MDGTGAEGAPRCSIQRCDHKVIGRPQVAHITKRLGGAPVLASRLWTACASALTCSMAGKREIHWNPTIEWIGWMQVQLLTLMLPGALFTAAFHFGRVFSRLGSSHQLTGCLAAGLILSATGGSLLELHHWCTCRCHHATTVATSTTTTTTTTRLQRQNARFRHQRSPLNKTPLVS